MNSKTKKKKIYYLIVDWLGAVTRRHLIQFNVSLVLYTTVPELIPDRKGGVNYYNYQGINIKHPAFLLSRDPGMDTSGKPNLFRLATRKSFGGDKMVMPRRLVKHLAPLQCHKSELLLR